MRLRAESVPLIFALVAPMDKTTAFELLGGEVHAVSRNLQCTVSAVHKWPKAGPLPRRVADRVLAARVRMRAELMSAHGIALDPLEQRAIAL